MKDKQQIIVIDQTIREGMQHRGLMFSLDERMKILAFQETLGVDISQVAYPPAHSSEMEIVKALKNEGEAHNYKIRIAGHGRAVLEDIELMEGLGIKDFHLHSGVNEEMLKRLGVTCVYDSLKQVVESIKSISEDNVIKISLLDIGKTNKELLKECGLFLAKELKVDILALPDTSGIMTPNIFHERVKRIAEVIADTDTMIAVHCHNDLGMSSANTIMGVIAGAKAIEVSAMGIGERNGIGDMFLVDRCLKQQGFYSNLKTEDTEIFKEYYNYLNHLYKEKLGDSLIVYNTPFWGNGTRTHVAGTHGCFDYGIDLDTEFCINVLCGKHLLRKFLQAQNISYKEELINEIVQLVKDKSVALGRSLSKQEVIQAVHCL